MPTCRLIQDGSLPRRIVRLVQLRPATRLVIFSSADLRTGTTERMESATSRSKGGTMTCTEISLLITALASLIAAIAKLIAVWRHPP